MNPSGEDAAGPHTAKTMAQLLRACAAAYGDDCAVKILAEDGPAPSISFAELERRSAEIARGLIARGIGKGNRIGFIMGNGPDFALMLAAASRIGAIAIPVSTMIRANELVRVLRQSDIAGLVVQRAMLGHDLVERLCDALPELREGTSGELRIPRTPFLRLSKSPRATMRTRHRTPSMHCARCTLRFHRLNSLRCSKRIPVAARQFFTRLARAAIRLRAPSSSASLRARTSRRHSLRLASFATSPPTVRSLRWSRARATSTSRSPAPPTRTPIAIVARRWSRWDITASPMRSRRCSP